MVASLGLIGDRARRAYNVLSRVGDVSKRDRRLLRMRANREFDEHYSRNRGLTGDSYYDRNRRFHRGDSAVDAAEEDEIYFGTLQGDGGTVDDALRAINSARAWRAQGPSRWVDMEHFLRDLYTIS